PFGSFSGGPDVTNLGNLNVHYTFPIFSKPGRGLPFNYALSSDSSVWYPKNASWTPVVNWGWRGPSDALTGYVLVRVQPRHCIDPDTGFLVFYTMRFYGPYIDGYGITHPGIAVEVDDSLCGPGSSDPGGTPDGSGYPIVPQGGSAQV